MLIEKLYIYSLKYLLTSLLCIASIKSFCQEDVMKKTVTGNYKDIPLKNVLSEISKQCKIRLSYSPKQIPEDSLITIRFYKAPLEEVLKQLKKQTNFEYELIDNYIVLKKSHTPVTEAIIIKEPTPKKFYLTGFIKDSTNGEFLPGAFLNIKNLKTGTMANGYGFFSIALPTGTYEIEFSFLGYKPKIQTVEISKNTKIDFDLNQGSQQLEDVVVSSVKRDEIVFRKRASQQAILPEYISKRPAIMGEPDIIKSLEFQPGIVFQNDGSSFFHVRGGNYDQNLIILDDAPIFNPSHLLGIFSPIIPDAIQSANIYKSDFPVNYGGRLSSVLDIRTKDGNKNKFSASGNIGIISMRATIEGPLKKESSSYFISYRRSYFDLYIKPRAPRLDHLYFQDFTGKVNIKLGEKDRLYFTLYNGKDLFRVKEGVSDQVGLDWGNVNGTIRWNHNSGLRAFFNTTLFLSSYNYNMYTSVKNNTYWNSKIASISLKEDFTLYINSGLTVKSGISTTFYNFNPGNFTSPNRILNIQVSPANSTELTLFTGAEHRLFPSLLFNYGLRLTNWSNRGPAFVMKFDEQFNNTGIVRYKKNEKYYSFSGLEPRLSVSWNLKTYLNIKASVSKNYQYINQISNSLSPFNSLEVWLPAGPNIKPQSAEIIDFGYTFSINSIKFSTCTYYKWLYNQIAYAPHARMLVNPSLEGELRQGKGRSYGIEFSLHKENGRLQGGIDYTYSRSILSIPEISLNSFPANFDRPHNLTFELAYKISNKWHITANYHIMSGMRYTSPTSYYIYQGYQVPVYSTINNQTMPVYKRFDISSTLNLSKPHKAFQHFLVFAVINFFNQVNPVFINQNKTVNSEGEILIPTDKSEFTQYITTARYIYGFIPSLNYQFKF